MTFVRRRIRRCLEMSSKHPTGFSLPQDAPYPGFVSRYLLATILGPEDCATLTIVPLASLWIYNSDHSTVRNLFSSGTLPRLTWSLCFEPPGPQPGGHSLPRLRPFEKATKLQTHAGPLRGVQEAASHEVSASTPPLFLALTSGNNLRIRRLSPLLRIIFGSEDCHPRHLS